MQISSSEISSMELLNINNLKQNTAGISIYLFFLMLFSALLDLLFRSHRAMNIKYLPISPVLHQGADKSKSGGDGGGGGQWERKCR